MERSYDLHIHTALSPCADDDMTPAGVVGFSALAGADIIAVTDHNSALNLPYVKKACDAYGVAMIPGIEVNTAEEIHLLCYFKSVEKALGFGAELYVHLPDVAVGEDIWNRQLIVDENGAVVGSVEKLLTNALDLGIYEVAQLCADYGGVYVPAHADRGSFSLLSVFGFSPEDLRYRCVELTRPDEYGELVKKKLLPGGLTVLASSDAHSLAELSAHVPRALPRGCELLKLAIPPKKP